MSASPLRALEGRMQVTPEAVIHRYLQLIHAQPLSVEGVVLLVGTDADLLARWLRLMDCPARPATLRRALAGLGTATLVELGHAQAFAVLPSSGSARLSLDQWQSVLQTACVAEVFASAYPDRFAKVFAEPEAARPEAGAVPADEVPVAIRWLMHLALSGVNLAQDAKLSELIEFRGARVDMLEDAAAEHRLLAVLDVLEVQGRTAAADLAQRLFDVQNTAFDEVLRRAEQRALSLMADLSLVQPADVDGNEFVWWVQQIQSLSGLFLASHNQNLLRRAHALASRSLFHRVPALYLLPPGARNRSDLQLEGPERASIPLASHTSQLAAAVRSSQIIRIADDTDASVADRQALRRLGAEEGLCVPLTPDGVSQGLLLFGIDEEVNNESLMIAYAEALGRWLSELPLADGADDRLLQTFRTQEERRLREIVHEANNPLSIVNNYLHILEIKLQHDAGAIEQLQLIGRELQRAAAIIQQAREVPSEPLQEAPAEQIDLVDFDLNVLVRRLYELHKGYADQRDVILVLELHRGPLRLRSDEQRITQILSNLAKNAIEAAGEGDQVSFVTDAGVYREGRAGVEVSVRDTGPGLPDEVLRHLYEPKRSQKGGDHQGLGLSIVRRLVSEIAGSIDVRTRAGAGTEFTIFLPLDPG